MFNGKDFWLLNQFLVQILPFEKNKKIPTHNNSHLLKTAQSFFFLILSNYKQHSRKLQFLLIAILILFDTYHIFLFAYYSFVDNENKILTFSNQLIWQAFRELKEKKNIFYFIFSRKRELAKFCF